MNTGNTKTVHILAGLSSEHCFWSCCILDLNFPWKSKQNKIQVSFDSQNHAFYGFQLALLLLHFIVCWTECFMFFVVVFTAEPTPCRLILMSHTTALSRSTFHQSWWTFWSSLQRQPSAHNPKMFLPGRLRKLHTTVLRNSVKVQYDNFEVTRDFER